MQKVKRIGRRVTILLWILLWVGTGWGLPCQGQEHPQPAIWGAAASEPQPTGMTQNAPHSVQRSPLSPQVTVKEGKLSVALNGAPVREVLEAIAYQSGIRAFLMAEGIQATFTDAFDELLLRRGCVASCGERAMLSSTLILRQPGGLPRYMLCRGDGPNPTTMRVSSRPLLLRFLLTSRLALRLLQQR